MRDQEAGHVSVYCFSDVRGTRYAQGHHRRGVLLRPGADVCGGRTYRPHPEAVRRLVGAWADPGRVRACYEAGPTGYELQGLLSTLGNSCEVIAPALVPALPTVLDSELDIFNHHEVMWSVAT